MSDSDADLSPAGGNGRGLDPGWVAELTPYANGLRMALAEAGYPNAEVDIAWSGVFVTGAPSAVIAKAADICSGINPEQPGGE